MSIKCKQKKTILFLAANPQNTPRKMFDQECSEIEKGLELSNHRELFVFKKKFSVKMRDIRRALLYHEPQIVHFCGHSESGGFIVEGEGDSSDIFSRGSLAELLQLFEKNVECVMLSGCYSEELANAINEKIAYVAGIEPGVPDKTAIEIIVAFYDGVVHRKTYEFSYKLGVTADMHISEDQIDTLFKFKVNQKIAERKLKGSIRDQKKAIKMAIRSFCKDYAIGLENKVEHMLSLCHHFDGRFLVKGTWQDIKVQIEDFLRRNVKPGDHCDLYLPLHCSLAFLVGRILHAKYGVKVSLYQPSSTAGLKLWELLKDSDYSKETFWKTEKYSVKGTGEELASAISVSRSTIKDVRSFVEHQCPNISQLVHLEIANLGLKSVKNAGHAFEAAAKGIRILNDKCREMGASRLHLFISAPNVFTFMLGQHSQLLTNITLYEFPFGSNAGEYSPSITV